MERRSHGTDGGGKIRIGVCVMEKKVRVLGQENFEFSWFVFLGLAAMRE